MDEYENLLHEIDDCESILRGIETQLAGTCKKSIKTKLEQRLLMYGNRLELAYEKFEQYKYEKRKLSKMRELIEMAHRLKGSRYKVNDHPYYKRFNGKCPKECVIDNPRFDLWRLRIHDDLMWMRIMYDTVYENYIAVYQCNFTGHTLVLDDMSYEDACEYIKIIMKY